jgi:O-antigen/teichoic acid export membrane protein
VRFLARNIVALFILQGSVILGSLNNNAIFGARAWARVLGVENFGLLGVAAAIVGYVSLVSDWGFATSPIRRHFIGSFGIRFLAKAFLCGGSLAVFLTAIFLIPQWRNMVPILLVYSLSPVTAIFGAGWFLLVSRLRNS